jgi:hypothetical protein
MSIGLDVRCSISTLWFDGKEGKLCRIQSSPSGGYEEFYLLGYNAIYSVESQPTFWCVHVTCIFRLEETRN